MGEESDTERSTYLATLLLYFEEEIMGEAYFYGLAQHHENADHRAKLEVMAEVERFAAESIRPLIEKYDLQPRSDAELVSIGKTWIERHADTDWDVLMADISVRYYDYLDEFYALEAMAPAEDLRALDILTKQEVAAIVFALKEVAGDADSLVPLRRYMSSNSKSG